MSIVATNKSKRGRPRVDSEDVHIRVASALLGALAAWIAKSDDPKMSRAEAIRRLLTEALGARRE
jgi:hypothetical protein